MPAYYFHLAFELYRQSAQEDFDSTTLDEPISSLPPRNFDIFQSRLVDSKASSWASFIAPKREKRRSLTPSNRSAQQAQDYRQDNSAREQASGSVRRARDTIEGRQSRPDLPASEHNIPPKTRERDWRFGRVTMESIDMEFHKPSHGDAEVGSKNSTTRGDVAMRGRYVPSNPETTDFGWGVVHLYRDTAESPELEDGTRYGRSTTKEQPVDISADLAFVDKQCTTLCILAVPSYMTPSDLFGWLGEDTREIVSHLRLVRTGRSNRYMVLLKFRSAKTAKKWQNEWNGKLFNSAEPENCHVVFVKSIQFQAPDSSKDPSSFPDMSNDPFTPMVRPDPAAIHQDGKARAKTSLNAKPAPPPTPALIELPTCPVCLERMDETTGLATIFCQHVFHCACLQKWRGSGCPVCRYTQNDPGSRRQGQGEDECKTCGSRSNIWICLICGHVGCGRYEGAHAFEHYDQTGHSYAMDVTTQHVWDYVGDGYVHRLIQSAADGQLVELPSAMAHARIIGNNTPETPTPRQPLNRSNSSVSMSPQTHTIATDLLDDTSPPNSKLEKLSLEYTNLLTSQLDSQRLYFEQQLDRAVDKAARASADAIAASTSASEALQNQSALESAHNRIISETLPTLRSEAERASTRAERAEVAARKMEKAYREAESVSGGLMERIKYLEGLVEVEKRRVDEEKRRVEEEKRRVEDLEEQNRDLTFFISAGEKLKAMSDSEEVKEGTVSVAANPKKKQERSAGEGGGAGGAAASVPGTAKKRRKKKKAVGATSASGNVTAAGKEEVEEYEH